MTEISFEIGENGLNEKQLNYIVTTRNPQTGTIDWAAVAEEFNKANPCITITSEIIREKYYDVLDNIKIKNIYSRVAKTKPNLELPDSGLTQEQFDWLSDLKNEYGKIPWQIVFPFFEEENEYCTIDLLDKRFRGNKIAERKVVDILELKRQRDVIDMEIAKAKQAQLANSARPMPTFGKEVCLFDLHYGKNRDGKNIHLPIDHMLEFLSDYQPDVFILGGDVLDNLIVSHWEENDRLLSKYTPLLKDYYNSFEEDIMKKFRLAVGKKCYIIFMLGNHDDWINQLISKVPNTCGFLEIENNVQHVDMFVPYRMDTFVKIGRLHFSHGYCLYKYHAQKVASDYLRAVRYGHTHTYQSYTQSSAVDNRDYHVAISCGCYCSRAASYMKQSPNSWVNAFQVGEVMEDGSFYDYVPILNTDDKSFKAEGKIYKLKNNVF